MFLSRKRLARVLLWPICYISIGGICLWLGMRFSALGVGVGSLFTVGAIACVLGVLIIPVSYYNESKAKVINLGNKLVCHELRPAEFINVYEALRKSEDLLVNRPSIDILQLAAIAYDASGDRENSLATVDELVAVAGEKKKTYANLIKVSFLFGNGKADEAEKLFAQTQKNQLDIMCKTLSDAIMKSDRAMAMGDYKIVEAFALQRLSQSVPKLHNLGKLVTHYQLAEVYEKMQDPVKAATHYQYCVSNGGETALKASAGAALERLQCAK